MTWTVAKVKAELPAVMIKIGKQRPIAGRLSGRVNRFATVSVTNQGTLHSGSIIFADWQFAWETVASCLNRGRPLRV